MDDHHLTLKAYERVLFARLAGGFVVLVLAGLALVLAWSAAKGWQGRYERVFEPIPGLVYAPPTADVGLTTESNPVPLTFQALDRTDAYRFNASIPVSTEPLEPAAPFRLPAAMAAADRARALNCLTQAIYYEAANESALGQRAVAQVVLNRVRHPAFPSSVCGVVYSGSQRTTGCQFTFTCDGSLGRPPSAASWARARVAAADALSGRVEPAVGQATHYHALYVAPYWSPSLLKVANIGAHTFYRWKGFNGKRAAFVSAYAGREPVVSGRLSAPEAEPAAPVEIMAAPSLIAVAAPPAAPPAAPMIVAPTVERAPEDTQPASAEAPPAAILAPAPAAPVHAPEQERPRRRVARADW